MNIAKAKEYIKNTVKVYLTKDEYGDYKIPVMRQRPVFLLGAPGIGKTAIMEQIASELEIGLVSYSMTHHTRQSALGLPYIEEKNYGGEKVSVSEYTMSEIIASVYETMEASGVKEGILFLDEINCVSETLAPAMLLFLQYKMFGKHKVPEGWVIVTAGNPPEFNKSVREFDVVTLDRLKVINVEADYPAWKAYAVEKGIHGSILNFLDSKRDNFYTMETSAEGREFATARGWEDLSDVIYLYEAEGLKVNDDLIGQYIRNPRIVREYSAYYDLYNKYKNDYRADKLLEGEVADLVLEKAGAAGLDERLAMVGLLLSKVRDEVKDVMRDTDAIKEIKSGLKKVLESGDVKGGIQMQIEARDAVISSKTRAGSLSDSEKKKLKRIKALYSEILKEVNTADGDDADIARKKFNGFVASLKAATERESIRINNMLYFINSAFTAESNEMLVAITELTVGVNTSRFLNMYGSDGYDKYNALLMVADRTENLRQEITELTKDEA